MASHTSVAASAFSALFLLSAAAVAAEPKLFSRAGDGQKFDAYLVSKEATGLGKNHFANVRFVSPGKKSNTAEWIVNCNPGFPQVVSPSNVNTFLKVNERPAAKDRFKYELWFAVCEGKTQRAAGQRPPAEEDCPVDRLVFKDTHTNREFVSERVAVDYRYICDGKLTRSYDSPQKRLAARCQGPYGDTVIEGLLDGEQAHAIYSVITAAPCCVWYSHNGSFKPSRTKAGIRWLKPSEVWSVQLGDEWYEIGPSNPPYDDDKGPMGGGEFRPISCVSR